MSEQKSRAQLQERERLQASLSALHARIPAEQAAKLLELRQSLPPHQPPLPGLEDYLGEENND